MSEVDALKKENYLLREQVRELTHRIQVLTKVAVDMVKSDKDEEPE